MSMLLNLMRLAVAATLLPLAMAAKHTVGGPNGAWDEATDVKTWASSQSFSVGDSLVFQYAPSHDVMEVKKADYDSCQATNPIKTYSGGSTVIPLSTPGKKYFICGTPGHCDQGMKMEIDALATSTKAGSPKISPAASPAPEVSSPTPTPSVSPLLPPESADSPLGSPTDIPSAETPGISPSAFGSSQQPSASSANRGVFKATFTLIFSMAMMILQIQAV